MANIKGFRKKFHKSIIDQVLLMEEFADKGGDRALLAHEASNAFPLKDELTGRWSIVVPNQEQKAMQIAGLLYGLPREVAEEVLKKAKEFHSGE